MRVRTAAALAVVVAALLVAVGVGVTGGEQVSLSETWVSDTDRENRVNHHAVAVGPNGSVLAPVAAVVNAEPIGPTSCSLVRLRTDDGATLWRAPVPAANCTTHAITEPAVADLDGDPALETAVATTEKAVVVGSLRTGEEEWRIPLPAYGYGRPAVGNLTRAPGAELLASDIEGNVVVANRGAVQWRARLDGVVWAAPVVADVDADGRPEAVVGTSDEVVAFDADGTVAWRTGVGATTMTAGQVDGDGPLEVVATGGGSVRVLDGVDGRVEHRWNATGTTRVAEVADGDADGDVEVYVGIARGHVVALDPVAGRVEWRTTVSETEQMTPAPRVADLTGDGTGEVIAPANDGTVAVLDPATGAVLDAYERDVLVWTKPTTADVDGDGAAEVFVRYGDGRVARLDGGGE